MIMKRLILALFAATLLISCTNQVKISGEIANASEKTLYFEYVGLNGTSGIDSTTLDSRGKFSFKTEIPQYPDFYRLRIGTQSIVISLDSLSEKIDINGVADSLSYATIIGSPESVEIQKLRNLSFTMQRLAAHKMTDEVAEILEEHRAEARRIILSNTRSAAAYYAINQTFNGYYYISPYEKEGLQLWSAVATAYDLFFPEYERSITLKNIVLLAIKEQRTQQIDVTTILESTRQEGFIEITLPDRRDENIKLSSLVGNMVLIDFSAYSMEGSSAHSLFLREIYNRYNQEGLEIYQISSDANKLLWLERIQNIPWICVRDKNAPNSICLSTYNIEQLPTMFLMDREGTIIGRFTHETIELAIKKRI